MDGTLATMTGTEEIFVDAQTRATIRDGLNDATPRQAALAMLRFGEYLRRLRGDGVTMNAPFVLALYEELQAIVRIEATGATAG